MPTLSRSEQYACDAVTAIDWVDSYELLLDHSIQAIGQCLYCAGDRSRVMLHGLLGRRLIQLEITPGGPVEVNRPASAAQCRWARVRFGRR